MAADNFEPNGFLAPRIATPELQGETGRCPECRAIRQRSRVDGAVCFTHFLQIAGTARPDSRTQDQR